MCFHRGLNVVDGRKADESVVVMTFIGVEEGCIAGVERRVLS